MLSKKERLSRAEFNLFFSVGRKFHGVHLGMSYVPYHELHASVVVSRKIEKTAVKRNKIRRRIYAILRHAKAEQDIHGVYIFFVKKNVSAQAYDVLSEEVQTLIKKATTL
jgi:ribonuclease P protein component